MKVTKRNPEKCHIGKRVFKQQTEWTSEKRDIKRQNTKDERYDE